MDNGYRIPLYLVADLDNIFNPWLDLYCFFKNVCTIYNFHKNELLMIIKCIGNKHNNITIL